MKLSIVTALFAATGTANIVFPFVQPRCNNSSGIGCLRGQHCLSDGTCVSHHITRDATPREDGRCGDEFGGATCDTKGEYGGCCSGHGYCGKTVDHCLVGNGCQSGCTNTAVTSPVPQPDSTDVSPGGINSEPVIAPPSSTGAATGPETTDGTCGASNGGTTCGDWPQGGCCSMYGFCGKSTAHCGEGCQSGPCAQAPISPAPMAALAPKNANPGSFKVVGQSGVPAMHAALMPNGRVVFLDKVEDYTQVKLSNGHYAYSAEYDPVTNTYTPLPYRTNAFCSGGSFLPNGTLLNVGGNAPLTWLDYDLTKSEQCSGLLQRYDFFYDKNEIIVTHGHVCSYLCLLQPALTLVNRLLRVETLSLFYATNEFRLMVAPQTVPNKSEDDAAFYRSEKLRVGDKRPLAVSFWRAVGDTNLRNIKLFALSLSKDCDLCILNSPYDQAQLEIRKVMPDVERHTALLQGLDRTDPRYDAKVMLFENRFEKKIKECAEQDAKNIAYAQTMVEGGFCVQNIERALSSFAFKADWVARLKSTSRVTLAEQAAMDVRWALMFPCW
ncbi:hypothetical protein LTR27_007088 [Elasticomyces elasticus]|nr:hypothetical protein LTR27_007088 [Elasticomyces elasticus]